MKKILILLLLLTSSLTLSATLYAWDLNDQPIPELNGLTLREVSEGGNLYTLGETILNKYAYGTQQMVTVIENHYYYVNRIVNPIHSYIPNNDNFGKIAVVSPSFFFFLNNNQVVGYSSKIRQFPYSTAENIELFFYGNPGYDGIDTIIFRNVHLIDITTLGIDNLTVEQMDNYYTQYISRRNVNYDLDDSKSTNVLTIMQDFQDILLGTEDKKGFVDYVDDFLFKERTVGFSIEWLGIYYEWKFKPFYLLGTTLFVTLMGLVLVKKFVPVA